MENMEIYEKVRNVPLEAQKPIKGGRLSGMTDINPMWRIKTLTEQFGVCGVGWKYEITEKRLEQGGNNEIAAFVDINLYIKNGDTWSEPIPGTGGSGFVTKEKGGLYTSDECFKMALTDAISVSCKMLGFGADIYWQKDRTKYSDADKKNNSQGISEAQVKRAFAIARTKGYKPEALRKSVVNEYKKSIEKLTREEYDKLCEKLENLSNKEVAQ